jgi:acyl-CoA synthetase (AMP-forming)/AMP-acid ligase II
MTSSTPPSRLQTILSHLRPSPAPTHPLSHLTPTYFLERAAAIEPHAEAVYHVTTNGQVLRRSYQELADRARGLAYYLRKRGHKRVGLLANNTPPFLECVYGIVAAGGVMVPVNYRLKEEDVGYILEFAGVDCVVVDKEFEGLLGEGWRRRNGGVEVVVDLVSAGFFLFLMVMVFVFFWFGLGGGYYAD